MKHEEIKKEHPSAKIHVFAGEVLPVISSFEGLWPIFLFPPMVLTWSAHLSRIFSRYNS